MKATISPDGNIHLDGGVAEIAEALATLFDDEPEPCSLTGRSCSTCKHQGECYGCGVHFANYEPPEPEQNCNTCRHNSESFKDDPCGLCAMSSAKPYSGWEPANRPQDDRPRHPGEVLYSKMVDRSLSMSDLVKKTGVSSAYWQDLILGNERIWVAEAMGLGRVFNTTVSFWCELQDAHDAHSRKNEGAG